MTNQNVCTIIVGKEKLNPDQCMNNVGGKLVGLGEKLSVLSGIFQYHASLPPDKTLVCELELHVMDNSHTQSVIVDMST